jgi:hypothetical protein
MGGFGHFLVLTGADNRQIDVEEKGSLDKAAVIAALGQSGDADYDSVSYSSLFSALFSRRAVFKREEQPSERGRGRRSERATIQGGEVIRGYMQEGKKMLMTRLERPSRMLMSIHRDDWKLKIGYSCTHY